MHKMSLILADANFQMGLQLTSKTKEQDLVAFKDDKIYLLSLRKRWYSVCQTMNRLSFHQSVSFLYFRLLDLFARTEE